MVVQHSKVELGYSNNKPNHIQREADKKNHKSGDRFNKSGKKHTSQENNRLLLKSKIRKLNLTKIKEL